MIGGPRSLALLGASGLVGGHVLRRADADPAYARITVITRRPLGLEGGKIREAVVDFDQPETLRAHVGVDDVFCCLGTTLSKAGSEDAFRKVDYDAPVAAAREALAKGAGHFAIVTAVGADPASRIFYSRVKGQVEVALRALDFPRGLTILRPSLIVGRRSERRPAERAAMTAMRAARPLLVGPMARYRAIDADAVAAAMIEAAREAAAGVRVYEGRRLFDLARARA